ncbi:hypothetical protein OsJ_08520 [Oryza sativa Japonica Group]|uniref:inorganic diphosphatase n=1 Tax=Oryza sativa subsp. japonica TaxID=39947 RepID=A3ABR0_ORYSJ|nr:hypothetical protein OsJ_08520 [Oryza sativa Japonica Group]
MATAATASATAATRFTRLAGVGLRRTARLPTAVRFQRRVLATTALLRTAELRPKEQGLPETLDYRVFSSTAGAARYNINWNYGLFPQTWEDPTLANTDVEGAFGDNDPVDVVEIGERRANIGDVLKVKPLAALAMIDEGELDWKIVAISLDDPKASLVNDVDDVEKHFPGTLTAIRDWFRDYKIPDGKPANRFGLGNKPTSKEYALKVIEETNESWEKLVKRNIPAGELSLA